MKEKKLKNYEAALYIAENYGINVSEEKLKKVAKKFNYKPNVLIKNYKLMIKIVKIFKIETL